MVILLTYYIYLNVYIREDLSKLNYVTLCIKETMRLYPLLPFVGKLSSEDVVVNGYRIPKGIKLHSNK